MRGEITTAFSKVQGVRVTPLSSTDPIFNSMDDEWVERLEKIQGVKVAVGNIIQTARTIDDKPQTVFTAPRVLGLDVDRSLKATSTGFSGELLEGRDFQTGDRGVALIGKKIKDDYDKFLNSRVKVNEGSFRVVGVYTTGSDIIDSSILLPIDDARSATGFPKGKVSYINLTLLNPSKDREIVKRVNLIYGDEIKATTLSDFSAQFGQIFDSITALVVLIASIASVVAAVGIINTMLMSVLERFKEIGALKAVGWSSGNIMLMIVTESILLGIFGAIIGIALGLGASAVISKFGLNTIVTVPLLIGSFLGAVFVGLLAGVYPAYVASRMDPVEALRFE